MALRVSSAMMLSALMASPIACSSVKGDASAARRCDIGDRSERSNLVLCLDDHSMTLVSGSGESGLGVVVAVGDAAYVMTASDRFVDVDGIYGVPLGAADSADTPMAAELPMAGLSVKGFALWGPVSDLDAVRPLGALSPEIERGDDLLIAGDEADMFSEDEFFNGADFDATDVAAWSGDMAGAVDVTSRTADGTDAGLITTSSGDDVSFPLTAYDGALQLVGVVVGESVIPLGEHDLEEALDHSDVSGRIPAPFSQEAGVTSGRFELTAAARTVELAPVGGSAGRTVVALENVECDPDAEAFLAASPGESLSLAVDLFSGEGPPLVVSKGMGGVLSAQEQSISDLKKQALTEMDLPDGLPDVSDLMTESNSNLIDLLDLNESETVGSIELPSDWQSAVITIESTGPCRGDWTTSAPVVEVHPPAEAMELPIGASAPLSNCSMVGKLFDDHPDVVVTVEIPDVYEPGIGLPIEATGDAGDPAALRGGLPMDPFDLMMGVGTASLYWPDEMTAIGDQMGDFVETMAGFDPEDFFGTGEAEPITVKAGEGPYIVEADGGSFGCSGSSMFFTDDSSRLLVAVEEVDS